MFYLILPVYFIGSKSRDSGLFCHGYCLLLTMAFYIPGTILSIYYESINKLLYKYFKLDIVVIISQLTDEETKAQRNEVTTTSQLKKAQLGFEPIPSEASQLSQALHYIVSQDVWFIPPFPSSGNQTSSLHHWSRPVWWPLAA